MRAQHYIHLIRHYAADGVGYVTELPRLYATFAKHRTLPRDAITSIYATLLSTCHHAPTHQHAMHDLQHYLHAMHAAHVELSLTCYDALIVTYHAELSAGRLSSVLWDEFMAQIRHTIQTQHLYTYDAASHAYHPITYQLLHTLCQQHATQQHAHQWQRHEQQQRAAHAPWYASHQHVMDPALAAAMRDASVERSVA